VIRREMCMSVKEEFIKLHKTITGKTREVESYDTFYKYFLESMSNDERSLYESDEAELLKYADRYIRSVHCAEDKSVMEDKPADNAVGKPTKAQIGKADQREHKDRLFKKLFSEKEYFIDLYRAVSGELLRSDDIVPVAIGYSDKVGLSNDVAFKAGERIIVLMEHQASPNQNMPLRFLIYIAETFKALGYKEAALKDTLVRIPRPEFYIFYNGIKKFNPGSELKLSDAYTAGIGKKLYLEVTAEFYDLSTNKQIRDNCNILEGYYSLIGMIYDKHKNQGMPLEQAIRESIYYHKDYGHLQEFLKTHLEEVFNMLNVEFQRDFDAERILEEGKEVGKIEGKLEGKLEGKREAAINALSRGFSPQDIASITGLPIDEIEEMKKILQS
jgi:hypothetical protein